MCFLASRFGNSGHVDVTSMNVYKVNIFPWTQPVECVVLMSGSNLVSAVYRVLEEFFSVFYVPLDVCLRGLFVLGGCTFTQKYTRKEGEFCVIVYEI
ncbi:hypothetical protein DEAC_c36920 [Desulfosporosinus acididurans]|uniref:Uncharacterized protein n=1 Tax=Desulfosporosinus acididurans TaxID=476652 RepID=A0A0J1FLZ8_9FIRM|nr:hypothetical protein DEAC_c36920 [Desulfosporosinus acididurans]